MKEVEQAGLIVSEKKNVSYKDKTYEMVVWKLTEFGASQTLDLI